MKPTAQLPHITSASGYRGEDATVHQKMYHDLLARLAEQDQQLRPRRPFESVRMVVWEDGKQAGDARFVAAKTALLLHVGVRGFAEAIAKEVLGPRRPLFPREEEPDGEIHNLYNIKIR